MILSIVQLRLDDIAAGRQDARTMDAARTLLVDTLARRPDLDLKNLSLTIGRNHAYLQQYLMRGSARETRRATCPKRRATGSLPCSASHRTTCARRRRR